MILKLCPQTSNNQTQTKPNQTPQTPQKTQKNLSPYVICPIVGHGSMVFPKTRIFIQPTDKIPRKFVTVVSKLPSWFCGSKIWLNSLPDPKKAFFPNRINPKFRTVLGHSFLETGSKKKNLVVAPKLAASTKLQKPTTDKTLKACCQEIVAQIVWSPSFWRPNWPLDFTGVFQIPNPTSPNKENSTQNEKNSPQDKKLDKTSNQNTTTQIEKKNPQNSRHHRLFAVRIDSKEIFYQLWMSMWAIVSRVRNDSKLIATARIISRQKVDLGFPGMEFMSNWIPHNESWRVGWSQATLFCCWFQVLSLDCVDGRLDMNVPLWDKSCGA